MPQLTSPAVAPARLLVYVVFMHAVGPDGLPTVVNDGRFQFQFTCANPSAQGFTAVR